MTAQQPVSNWNLPNILTGLRILLVPVFAWLFITAETEQVIGYRWAAAGVFIAAIITDKLDGDIARARGLITNFGKIADPIADKLLIGAGLILLSWSGDLPWWVTIVILVREIGITLMRFVVIKYGVMPASKGGKIKTTLQAAGLILMLLPLGTIAPWLGTIGFWVMIAAAIVTVLTGLEYIVQAIRLRNSAKHAQHDETSEVRK
ncbi:CDP-diacylglycerol--glycerol-3-phosphate 3-phosphatidyltransferase [Micrococcoides hystricis]|uniref:CDP-diacylglycerol--glycerol-3-phosphate 3-phosphatidyltransferase n=1 Tax=Micrococcoides hystricis TaxID=1572761 RepID=A0ABV6P8L2_9MICC